MKVILNGKEVEGVTVTATGKRAVAFDLETAKGSWFLVRNLADSTLLGVVNRGSIRNHKFTR